MVRKNAQSGLVYLWMLFLVFLLGLGLGKSLDVYSTIVQREKEAELVYIGMLYRQAIRQFYLSSPEHLKRYPYSLEDLLKDPRSLTTRRYLRKLYIDPITGNGFFPVLAPEGGIMGVRSASVMQPKRVGGGLSEDYSSGDGRGYSGLEFNYRPGDN